MSKFNINGKSALVSGANRGLGKAIVEQLIERGASKIYAGSRKVENLTELVAKYGDKIIPVGLDVTQQASIDQVTSQIDQLDVLINNAGRMSPGTLLSNSAVDSLKDNLDVNVWGLLRLSNAVRDHFTADNPTAIINIISVAGFANMPSLGTYSVSKAAVHSVTQGMRGEMASKNTQVIGVYPGPMDTDMVDGWDLEKVNTTIVAQNILDGLEAGVDDIFPDNQSHAIGSLYLNDPKRVEAQFAQMV